VITIAEMSLPVIQTVVILLTTLIPLVEKKLPVARYIMTTKGLPGPTLPANLDDYFYTVIDRVLFYLVPALIAIWLLGISLSTVGLTPGAWRTGLIWTGVLAAIILGVGVALALIRSRQGKQISEQPPLLTLVIISGAGTFQLEFLFRGFLLFLLLPEFGAVAVVLQMVPHALSHADRKIGETFLSIPGGLFFGWIAWKTGSLYYPFLIHWIWLAFSLYFGFGGKAE